MQNEGKRRAFELTCKTCKYGNRRAQRGQKRGQKRGHNMLYTRVTSTKSLPPSSHPRINLRELKTQDKTPKKWRVMLTARQTMSDWDKLRWKEAHFPKNFPFQNSLRAKQEILWWKAWTSPSGMQLVFDCLFCCLLVIIHDILHIAPCQFQCISEMFTSQFQYPYSKIFLFHPKMMNTITKNGVHRTTVRSEQLS